MQALIGWSRSTFREADVAVGQDADQALASSAIGTPEMW